MVIELKVPTKERTNLIGFAKPAMVLVVFLLANVFLFQNGLKLTQNQLNSLSEKRNLSERLKSKIEILSSVDSSLINDNKVLIQSLPSTNPSLVLLSQINVLSETTGARVTDTGVTPMSQLDTEVSRANLKIKLESQDLNNLITFADGLKEYVPVNTLQSVKIKISRDVYTADLDVLIYWSQLPTVIGAESEVIPQLSSSEIDFIERINKLNQPLFETLSPREEIFRQNPFE